MSHSNNSNINEKIAAENEKNLEDLLKDLHRQIKSTNWLEVNNAQKFEQENPELIKAWNEAINNQNQN